jgi:hypothetical protein
MLVTICGNSCVGFSFSLEIGDAKLYADGNVPSHRMHWLLSEQRREAKAAHALKTAPLSLYLSF